MNYSFEQFEQDMASLKPRFMDIYVIPALLVTASVKAKRPLGRWTRRAVFTAGLYMLMRNYAQYKKAVEYVKNFKPSDINNIIPEVPGV